MNQVGKNTEKGKIVYDSYGLKENSNLFYNYGFIDTSTTEKFAVINITPEKVENLFTKIKNNFETEYIKNKIFILTSEGIKSNVIEYLRITNLTKQDFDKICFNEKSNEDFYKKIISIDNEASVIKTIMTISDKLVADYSKEEIDKCNEILLNNEIIGTNEYCIAKIVIDNVFISENNKKILKEYWSSIISK
jgi:hypothetical protein